MADPAAIRGAIATKLAAVSGIREATSTKLSNVTLTPSVKITHTEQGQTDDRGAGYEARTLTIKGKLFIAKAADHGRALQSVETYCEAITVAVRTGVLLGMAGTVQDFWLDTWDAGEFDYGGIPYIGADLTFKVELRENVTRTA